MPQTPGWGLPYPEADTLITDSAAIVQTLAEKIDAALSQVMPEPNNTYTIPGTLVQTFTTSGTFTPPPGVTVVHVAVIGGGNGGERADSTSGGGCGGGVRVFRDVPVSVPVAVVVGGSNTASSFGTLASPALTGPPWWSVNQQASNGGPGGGNSAIAGQNGIQVNGTYYAGGGGGGINNYSVLQGAPGGAGGGGKGKNGNDERTATNGTNGLGGGAGGGYSGAEGYRLGGSGRVMVWTEQAYRQTRDIPTPVDPAIVAGLDDNGVMTGAYAVEPDTPVVLGSVADLVPFPADPQPTGRMLTVPIDPEDPDGPTHEVPELAWPTAGWTFAQGIWTPPTEETL